ncbi:MAG TPA: PIN domain-containing protein [Candidatus Acidoferrum sp.]|nr:PIN domain-containing protein [Candidatus Acidoferrum sp.]
MSRTKAEGASSFEPPSASRVASTQKSSAFHARGSATAGVWLARAAFLAGIAALGASWQPFALGRLTAAAVGFVLAVALVISENWLRRGGIRSLAGGALGSLAGIAAALLVTLIVSRTSETDSTKSFLEFGSLFAFAYLGLLLGAAKGGEIPSLLAARASDSIHSAALADGSPKLLDTSVLIDGRIADICEAQFLDGPLHVPRFVLHELQQIADSSDTLRRQRGRRGLEVLQRMQKLRHAKVAVLEEDMPPDGEVDRSLVQLAKKTGAKIVTNDFNLNKVATVQGIAVLNVNQLANALRPAVLPGETMNVFILREGKEANQGVAFLEDGTMVVVDGARKFTNRKVDITVTSVHQTPAGKMIFGRMEERADGPPQASKRAAAGRGGNGS